METTHCLADAKHIRHFLDACDGNWHRCIYIKCTACKSTKSCTCSGFLFHPDQKARPLVLPLSDACLIFSSRPEPEECLATLTAPVFLSMYGEFLKSRKVLSPDCPCRALLDIQNQECYDW